jgi:hypothetical protein
VACGNNKVSRDYLSSQPVAHSPLREIHARVPSDRSADRLKADVWTTQSGSFADAPKTERRHQAVDSPGERRWSFVPERGADPKAYTHMTGRAAWLGPESVLDRLPPTARRDLEGKRVIVLGKDASQTWVNERATTFDSRGRSQTTVVRRAKK